MKKLDKETINKKGKANPIFKGLPDDLKTVEQFDIIESALSKAILSDHKHATIKGFVGCKRCSAKLERQKALKKEFGFTSQEQYLMWKKVMLIIKNKANFQLN